ncbi:MAG: FecR domain-containing protein [Flavobacteriales bacterium]|nr:FecR domain-containing protein [Flavobacteriales bacterium]
MIPIARGRAVPWLRIAAAAALVTGVFLAVRWWSTPEAQQYASEGTSTSVVLDDSSHVVLSPGSRILVAMGAERRVELEGQAYFEVTPDPQHPFVVEADGLWVTVLGTAFTVSAYDTSSTVLTRVRHGKVRVSADGRQVDLVAGEHAEFDERTRQLRKVEAPSIGIWGDRILMFSGTPLAEVVQQLSALYHVRIGLENDAVERCRLTATFENEPIDRCCVSWRDLWAAGFLTRGRGVPAERRWVLRVLPDAILRAAVLRRGGGVVAEAPRGYTRTWHPVERSAGDGSARRGLQTLVQRGHSSGR